MASQTLSCPGYTYTKEILLSQSEWDKHYPATIECTETTTTVYGAQGHRIWGGAGKARVKLYTEEAPPPEPPPPEPPPPEECGSPTLRNVKYTAKGLDIKITGEATASSPCTLKFVRFDWRHGPVSTGMFPQTFTMPSEGTFVCAVCAVQSDGKEACKDLECTTEAVAPPPEPAPPRIIGKVTDAVFGVPVPMAKVDWMGKLAFADTDGNYVIDDPAAMSGNIICSFINYITQEKYISAPVSGDLVVNFALQPEEAVPEYKVLPEPPVGWTTEQIEIYKRLDEACYVKDTITILDILRAMFDMEASPLTFAAVVLAIPKVATIIVTILGSIAFAAFLWEETLQTIDMCVWTAMSADDWVLAQKCLDKKAEILERTWVETLISYIPLVNVVAAVNDFVDASRVKMEVDQALIQKEQAAMGAPTLGDFGGYVYSIDQGAPDRSKLPSSTQIIINSVPSGAGLEMEPPYMTFCCTPLKFIPVDPGTYTIKCFMEGYQDQTYMLDIPAGFKFEHTFILKKVPEPGLATISVVTHPDGADVFVDGVLQKYPSNTVIENLTAGAYQIKVTKEGYEDQEKRITVGEGEHRTAEFTLVPIEYPPEQGTLSAISDPSGADVVIAAAVVGVTPVDVVLDPGSYTVTFRKTGYKDYMRTAYINAGQITVVSVVLLPTEEPPEPEPPPPEPEPPPSGKATLAARSAPTGAEVTVAGEVKGVTPIDIILDPGTYDVLFTKVDYKDESKTVYLPADQVTIVDVILTKEIEVVLPKYGSIEVISTPDRADIFLNGVLYEWKTNTVITELDPGTYTVKVHKTGYIDQEKTVVVEEDKRASAVFTLVPEEVVIPPGEGHLIIDTAPDYVELFLAGTSLGTLPPPGKYETDLGPGMYDFTFKKDGYYSTTRTAIIRAGETTYLSVSLIKIAVTEKLWRVDVSAVDTAGRPLSAKILVNDSFTGKYTPDYVLLNPGEYVFMITKSGYVPAEVPLTLEPI